MKKFLMFAAMVLGIAVSAEVKYPGVIELKTGDLAVYLRGADAASIAKITWKDKAVTNGMSGSSIGYDVPNAVFIGSGRKSKTQREILEKLVIKVDGKEVDFMSAKKFAGTQIEVERTSKIVDMNIVHVFQLNNGKFTETVTYTPASDLKIKTYYHLMSWGKNFKTYRVILPGGIAVRDGEITANNKFVVSGYAKSLILCDEKNNISLISTFIPVAGVPEILLLDRGMNSTEHYVVARNKAIPTGKAASYRHEVLFLDAKDADSAQDAADM